MADPIRDEISKASADYQGFEAIKQLDALNLKDKLKVWRSMNASPEILLMLFCMNIMAAGGPLDNSIASRTGLKANGSSLTRNQENLLTETGKELRYVSAYRDAISDIKQQLNAGKGGGGDPQAVRNDIQAMQDFIHVGIFQNADPTFTQSIGDLSSILNNIGPGKTYASFQDMWNKAQQMGDQQAGADIQKFTNAANNLFSMAGIQSNVLQTQLQDTQGNYKSFLAVIQAMVKSLYQVITQTLQKQTN